MTNNIKETNKYISQVKKYLICQPKIKKKILAELKTEIMSYAEEKETIDFSIICERFGKPEEIARTSFFDSDIDKIRKTIKKRNKFIAIIVVIAILLYAMVFTFVYIDANSKTTGYIIDATTAEVLSNIE